MGQTKARKERPKLSKEEKQRRTKELTDKLDKGVEEILDSEKFKEYLTFMSSFHDYSWGNVMLIMAQREDATMVAGFQAWKQKGRQVMKGEKGIRILAPLVGKDAETEEAKVFGFKYTTVFDISQTEGDEIPEGIPVTKLTGNSDEAGALYELALAFCEREEIPVEEEQEIGSALGVYDRINKSIKLASGLSADALAKTMIHEIVHHVLHKDAKYLTRSTAEVEAEGTAFVVCNHFGIDASEYSFGYVAQWAGEKDVLKAALKTIQKTANRIISDLAPSEAEAS